MTNAYENTAEGKEQDGDVNSLARLRRANGSRASLGSIKAKDILDAQEEIRPTDFRSRVQATGARDYGEDVADRNITRHGDGTASPTPDPQSTSNRTKSLNYSSLPSRAIACGDLSQHTPSDHAELPSFSRRNKRKLSLNTYIPTGMVAPGLQKSEATSPRLTDNVAARGFAPFPANQGPETVTRSRKLASPTTNNFSRPRSPQNIPVVAARGNIPSSHMDHVVDGRIAEVLASDNATSSDMSSNPRASNQSLGYSSPPRSPGRQSYQTFRSSLASSIPSRYPSTDLTPLGLPSARQAEFNIDPHIAHGEIEASIGRAHSSCKITCSRLAKRKYTDFVHSFAPTL
jgi:hypothetical protein